MKELVQKDISCDEKLKKIHELLGLPYHGESETSSSPGTTSTPSENEDESRFLGNFF